jgi:hypothetical protein
MQFNTSFVFVAIAALMLLAVSSVTAAPRLGSNKCPEDHPELSKMGLCYKPCEEGWKGVEGFCWKGGKSKSRGHGVYTI